MDERLRVAGPSRKYLKKAFPAHWSFLIGEVALFSAGVMKREYKSSPRIVLLLFMAIRISKSSVGSA